MSKQFPPDSVEPAQLHDIFVEHPSHLYMLIVFKMTERNHRSVVLIVLRIERSRLLVNDKRGTVIPNNNVLALKIVVRKDRRMPTKNRR